MSRQERTCARSCALSHGRACPRGFVAWGPGGRSGLESGGLSLGWAAFGDAGFFGSCGNSLLLAKNYNRTTTNSTAEAQSAQRQRRRTEQSPALRSLRAPGLPRPAAHWGVLLTCLGFTARSPESADYGPGNPGCIADCQAGLQ